MYLIVVLIFISQWILILSIFHVSDYSSVFFCTMSFQVFGSFLKLHYLSFCYWLVGFLIDSVYESLVRDMYHEYFSQFVTCLFILLIVYSDKQKLRFVWLVNFSLMMCTVKAVLLTLLVNKCVCHLPTPPPPRSSLWHQLVSYNLT